MRKEKATSLNKEMLDKCLNVKYGIIWAYCAAKNKPLSLAEIAKHYKKSVSTIWKSVRQLIELGAMEAVPRQKDQLFTLYQAKKDTYFPSEVVYD